MNLNRYHYICGFGSIALVACVYILLPQRHPADVEETYLEYQDTQAEQGRKESQNGSPTKKFVLFCNNQHNQPP